MTTAAIAEATVMMTEREARACVAAIKTSAEDIAAKLCDLKEQEGWRALGYKTWQECIRREFQMSRQHAHRLINSAIVQRVLAPVLADHTSPIGDVPKVPETHARQLVPLLDKPDDLREAYAEAIETTDGEPTDEAVRAAVDHKLGRPSTPIRTRSSSREFSQEVPEELEAFGFGDAPVDPIYDPAAVSNEPSLGPRTRFCDNCGAHPLVGEPCVCESIISEESAPDDGSGYPRVFGQPCTACGGNVIAVSEQDERALNSPHVERDADGQRVTVLCERCLVGDEAPTPISAAEPAPDPEPVAIVESAPAPVVRPTLAEYEQQAGELFELGELAGLTARLLKKLDARGVRGIADFSALLAAKTPVTGEPTSTGVLMVDFMDRSASIKPLLSLDTVAVAESLTPEMRGEARVFTRRVREWLDGLDYALFAVERATTSKAS